jgi:cell division protein FtsI/penicillin-binding protein 2
MCAVGFTVVVIRLFALQVVQHEQYAQFARDNQLQRERIPGPRGFMRDRYGDVVVDNALHFEVAMQWKSRDGAALAVRELATYIPIDTTKAMARFEAEGKKLVAEEKKLGEEARGGLFGVVISFGERHIPQ